MRTMVKIILYILEKWSHKYDTAKGWAANKKGIGEVSCLVLVSLNGYVPILAIKLLERTKYSGKQQIAAIFLYFDCELALPRCMDLILVQRRRLLPPGNHTYQWSK